MNKLNVLILVLCFTSTLQGQIGLESNSNLGGTYLRLKSPSLLPYGMNFGVDFINTTDPLSNNPSVLKLQSFGAGNVTVGFTDASGTGTDHAALTVRAATEANMDLSLEGDGKISTQGDMYVYLDDNDTSVDAFHVVGSDGITLMNVSEAGNHFLFGNLSLGTPTGAVGYRMSVDGKMIAEEVRVELSQDWPDYVFHADYQLTSLAELEKEIIQLGHLPGIPSASIVEDEGFDLGEMNRMLLEKIEELTLYIIEQNKEIEVIKKMIHK